MYRVLTTAICLTLLCTAAQARSLLLDARGNEVLGRIEQQEYAFTALDGSEVILPRISLHQLRAGEGGALEVTLKDGTEISGHLDGEIVISDGLLKRRFTADQISEVKFDVYVTLAPGAVEDDFCPIRAAVEVPRDLLVGKLKKWRTSRTRLAACGGTYLSGVDLARRKNILEPFVVSGEKPRKGIEVSLSPGIVLEAGRDQSVHFTFVLMQGERELARESRRHEGSAGTLNEFAPVKMWVAPDAFEADGEAPVLRFQIVMTELESEPERGSVFWWFTIRL